MGRDKKAGRAAATAAGKAKTRHKRQNQRIDWAAPIPTGLRARPEMPNTRSKHQTYYELVENKDKKKKLDFQHTHDKRPPPGFEFVPVGKPELTTACKELSREQEALIFIVAVSHHSMGNAKMREQMSRSGYHFRQTIVEQARAAIGESDESSDSHPDSGGVEPIPETQEEIDAQADAAIRDLFPRIPNTDRHLIIEHAFKKGATMRRRGPLVGTAPDIPLSRRIQLAVLAHIRHTHTRYDQLLKETTYSNARKIIEPVCLDILVKWRGDEETGRDQIDEILREVIIISDAEDEPDDNEDDEDDDDEEDEDDEADNVVFSAALPTPSSRLPHSGPENRQHPPGQANQPGSRNQPAHEGRPKLDQRGFRRYQAARDARWDAAQDRMRHEEASDVRASQGTVGLRVPGHPLPQLAPRPIFGDAPSYGNVQNTLLERPHLVAQNLDSRVLANDPDGRVLDPPQRHVRMGGFIELRSTSREHRPDSEESVRQTGSRAVARAEQLQDYLVPSIEPTSPGIGRHSSSPIFVRSVPAARPAGSQNEAAARPMALARHSPPRGFEDTDEPNKRRRVVYEPHEAVRVQSARGYNHPVNFEVAGRQINVTRTPQPGEPVRYIAARPSAHEVLQQAPAAYAVRRRFVDADGGVLRGKPDRPIVIEDWDVQHRRVEMLPAQGSYRDRSLPARDSEVVEVYRGGPAYSEYQSSVHRREVQAPNIPHAGRDGYDRVPVKYVRAAENVQRPQYPAMLVQHQHSPAVHPPPPVRRVETPDAGGHVPQYNSPVPRRSPVMQSPMGGLQPQGGWASPHPRPAVNPPREAVPWQEVYGAPGQRVLTAASNGIVRDRHTPQAALRQPIRQLSVHGDPQAYQPAVGPEGTPYDDRHAHRIAPPGWQYQER